MVMKPAGNSMSATIEAVPDVIRTRDSHLVHPAVFAERLVSREALERVRLPESDLLGLRNTQTGETLFVQESGLQRWLQTGR